MSAQGRPVTDTRNDAAVEYVSTRTLPFVLISLPNFHPRCSPVHEWAHGARGQDQGRRALRRVEHLEARARPRQGRGLARKKVRSVAGGAGPDADKFAAVGALHKKNTNALKAAGYKNTFAGAVPTHTHIARPSSEEDQIAALVKLGTINSKNLWVVCGATAFNSRVVMAAQTAILAKAENAAAEALSAAALELIQVEVAAAAAKERRGDKSDDTMPGDDLEAVVKFVHKKDSIKGWSSYNTKAKRVAFLASLVPVWTERVACDAPRRAPRRGSCSGAGHRALSCRPPSSSSGARSSRSPTCSGEVFGDDCSRAPRSYGCSHRRHCSPRRIAWCVRSSIYSLHS